MASQPATADSGYITDPGPLENTYTSDPSLQRTLAWYLSTTTLQSVQPHLTQFGAEAISEQVREWSADAERNVPYVKSHNVWGKRYDYDRLVTTEGWKQLGLSRRAMTAAWELIGERFSMRCGYFFIPISTLSLMP
ncbi:uncharacterized protein N7479_004822 [Penicillium vulpinum]|uniref:uncharacterized protein n=1 Tax=Penicillium vulpinum TaxID=29845 RepID=UPI00254811C9|nr:uncharacterized protein N7479_004822 [Penicillium vulpinum]KAJ5964946.1 hypothetical protein N7479_004822 [Penicillium vulpinum]